MLVLLIGAATMADMEPAWAVCALRKPAEASASADVIFVGKVTSVSDRDTTFDVIEVWKGNVGPVETVHRGTDFAEEPRYDPGPDPVVVFASTTFGGLRSIICPPGGSPSRMRAYRPADAHPPATGLIASSERLFFRYSPIAPLLVILAIVAVAVLATRVVRRRRARPARYQ